MYLRKVNINNLWLDKAAVGHTELVCLQELGTQEESEEQALILLERSSEMGAMSTLC